MWLLFAFVIAVIGHSNRMVQGQTQRPCTSICNTLCPKPSQITLLHAPEGSHERLGWEDIRILPPRTMLVPSAVYLQWPGGTQLKVIKDMQLGWAALPFLDPTPEDTISVLDLVIRGRSGQYTLLMISNS